MIKKDLSTAKNMSKAAAQKLTNAENNYNEAKKANDTANSALQQSQDKLTKD